MSPPRLAHRVSQIQPFQVMELVKRASALQHQGHPVIHMSIGEPDFTAPPAVLAALSRVAAAGHTQYTAANGIAPLRQAIAHHYGQQYGLDIAPSRIVVTAGASAALSLACCALVNPGDEVLMTDPSYPCNRHFVAAVDGIPRPVPVGPSSRFQMTAALLAENWRPAVRGTLLASPANPTGTSIAFDELARIVDQVRQHDGFALIDEIYLGLRYDLDPGQQRVHSALELGDDLIITNSFSKYFSMTGWRLGWLVVPENLAPVFEKLAQNLYICPSTLAQHAGLACFEAESLAIYESRRAEFRRCRDYIVPALRSVGLQVPVVPDGAFYVYLDCSAFGLDSGTFAARLLEEQFVSLVPGADFGTHDAQRYLRLSYATAYEKLEQAIDRLRGWLPTLRK